MTVSQLQLYFFYIRQILKIRGGWDYVKSLNIMLKQTHIFIGNKGQNSFHNYTGNKTLSFLHQLEGA